MKIGDLTEPGLAELQEVADSLEDSGWRCSITGLKMTALKADRILLVDAVGPQEMYGLINMSSGRCGPTSIAYRIGTLATEINKRLEILDVADEISSIYVGRHNEMQRTFGTVGTVHDGRSFMVFFYSTLMSFNNVNYHDREDLYAAMDAEGWPRRDG